MSDFLPFIVIGVTTGSVYGLAGMGLVLTYRTSGIFNFAFGSMASVSVLLFYALVGRADVPWQLAALLAILGIGPALGVAFERLARRLTPLATSDKVLAIIGLVLFIEGATTLWGSDAYGPGLVVSHPSLPGTLVRIFGVNVGVDQIIIVAVGLVMAAVLHLVLEHTRIGRSMRAVADNADLLALMGSNPTRAQQAGWALGIGFVTLSGMLLVLSPNYNVSVATLFLLFVQAFGAAAIGGFSNLPLTYLGGIVVGVIAALTTKYVVAISVLGGLPTSIPFLVLLILFVLPNHLAPERSSIDRPPARRVLTVPRWWRWPLLAAAASALLFVPLSKNMHLVDVSNEGLSYAIVFLGLALLVRTSGQVSLCQMGLAAIGATTFAHLSATFGFPWFAALFIGGLAGAAVGALVAIPAIRVVGIYLAIATFGFGVVLEYLGYPTKLMFEEGLMTVPRPVIGPFNAADDVTFYVVVLAVFLCALLMTSGIRRARLGRLLRALGDSPRALQAQGISLNVTKVAVFAIAAFLAGVGGALLVSQNQFLIDGPFDPVNSLTVVVVVLILRMGQPLTSLLAAGAYVVVPSYLGAQGQIWWLDVGFGAAAVLSAVMGSFGWIPRLQWAARPVPRHVATRPSAGSPSEHPSTLLRRQRGSEGQVASTRGLDIDHVTVRFGGILAVDDLSLRAPVGRITGLIGPNGAGKTTTFNVCSGLVGPTSGRVLLAGRDISKLDTSARARRGLGRSFQMADLFWSMTVRQNVELGREGSLAGKRVLSHFVAAPGQAAQVRAAASEAMELVGIAPIADREIATLSTAERRLVELARCLAGQFDVLLLDEPSAGLDHAEARRFATVLTEVVDARGVGVLLVEHNMSMVMDICDPVNVLDFGRLIFSGPPADVANSEVVRAAYLGVE
jgi:ABC-type branched-subunit amino acid transport system ATPase component/branched-subunit amino acid ABC-type transport system permease component